MSSSEEVMVDLRGTRIGDKRVKSIAKALEKADHLTYLDLSQNTISDSGAELLATALAAGQAPKLSLLNLVSNNLTPACCESLTATLSARKSLVLELFDAPVPAVAEQEECMPITSPVGEAGTSVMPLPVILKCLKNRSNTSELYDALENVLLQLRTVPAECESIGNAVVGHVVRVLRDPGGREGSLTTVRHLAACIIAQLAALPPKEQLDVRLLETHAVELCLGLFFQVLKCMCT